jgi:hypothetical protein
MYLAVASADAKLLHLMLHLMLVRICLTQGSLPKTPGLALRGIRRFKDLHSKQLHSWHATLAGEAGEPAHPPSQTPRAPMDLLRVRAASC